MARPFTIARAAGVYDRIVAGESLANVTQPSSQTRDTVRFLFDSEDLLETGIGIRSMNAKTEFTSRILGMVKLFLRTPSLHDFQKKYSDLSPVFTQVGMEEKRQGTGGHKFMLSRHEEGEAIASYGTALDARKYLRRGVPHSLRARIWRISLALPDTVTSKEVETFNALKNYCMHLGK